MITKDYPRVCGGTLVAGGGGPDQKLHDMFVEVVEEVLQHLDDLATSLRKEIAQIESE